MQKTFLGLGSNIGNRLDYLAQACRHVAEIAIIEQYSSIYQTEPVGFKNQPWFLNMVLECRCTLSPDDLLEQTKQIETILARERNIRWGPRTIDIDILAIENVQIKNHRLTLPHPEMDKRLFVLIPFAEIAGGFFLKTKEKTVKQLLVECDDKNQIELYLNNKTMINEAGSWEYPGTSVLKA